MRSLATICLVIIAGMLTPNLQAQDYALNFNGSGQYVDCGNFGIDGAEARTVEAWVYTESFNDGGVWQMGSPGNALGEFSLRTTYSENVWVVQIWTTDFSITVPNSKNNWVHFAMTYDGTTIRIYANGELAGSAARNLNTLSADFFIGRWGNIWFDGRVDEVQVFTYARSQVQIQRDMMGYSSNDGDLNRIGYYTMHTGSGTTLDNIAWYHNWLYDGTILGGASWVTGVFENYPDGAGTSGEPYQIGSIRDLRWLSQTGAEWDKDFRQIRDIDVFSMETWITGDNDGFPGIGRHDAAFTGSYDGDGYAIQNLFVERDNGAYANASYVGFFPRISNATITDLALTNASVDGYRYTGALTGEASASTISNCSVSGAVYSAYGASLLTGGLIGNATNSDIDLCSSSATVQAAGDDVGGLIGGSSSSTVDDCYSSGSVSSFDYPNRIGGLIGTTSGTTVVTNCYTTGSVTATSNAYEIGGLIGKNQATVTECYTLGTVTGGAQAGGLIGYNYSGGTINNCYSKATITGSQFLGGLIGENDGAVNHSHATGSVSGGYQNMGGLIGYPGGTVSNSFWDIQTTGQSTSAGGTGKTTDEMTTMSTFADAGWTFPGTWHIDETISSPDNSGYPSLTWQGLNHILKPVITTQAVDGISTTSATGHGNITSLGTPNPTQYGVCWNTSTAPTTSNSKTQLGAASATGPFTSSITGLTAGTTYYVRAYATNTAGTIYGNEVSFTSYVAPQVTTQATSDIGTTTATGNGTVTVTGIPDPTEHGVCWNTDHNPTLANSHTSEGALEPVGGSASATYTAGDIPTDYSFRDISTSSSCPGELTITIPINATVTSVDVQYSMSTASNGYMSEQRSQLRCVSLGGASEAQVYTGTGTGGTFTYNRTGLTIANGVEGGDIDFELHAGRTYGGSGCNTTYNKVDDGTWVVTVHYTVPGNVFTSLITGLTPFTTYYAKAYATNAVGTVYGNEVSFTTLKLPAVTTQAITDIFTTTATGNGNITDLGNPNPTQYGHCWSTSEVPTIADAKTTLGTASAIGAFTSSLTGLTTSTTYYVRAYATNSAGTVYGEQQSFTTWDALPVFSVAPTSHEFGTLLIGESAQQTFTVSNTGGGYLYITSVTTPDGEYSVSPTSATIAGSESQVFTLTFTPITAGVHNGNLAFTDNAGNHTVAITGSGAFSAQTDAGNMLTLNGSSQYLEADIVTTATNNVTLEAWVNWDGQSVGNNAGILYSGTSGANGYGIMLRSGDGTVQKLTILLGNVQYLSTTTPLPTNSWHHVAAVRESGTWALYLDGVAQTLSSNTWTPHVPTGKCTIGSLTSGTQNFKGKIDEVRVWNVARSQTQIRTSYSSLAGNETGLAAYWRIDEGSGTSTGDGSGHSKTATLYNSPAWGISTAPITTPVFSASPASHAFETVLIGESASQTITISNNGGGVLHIASVASPGSDFTVSPTSADIPSGGNQVLTVTFTPTTTAAQSGDFTFTDNIGNHTVGVSGAGIYQAQADAGSGISFDGTDDYIQTGLDAQPSVMATTTWEAWIKPGRLNYAGGYQSILSGSSGN